MMRSLASQTTILVADIHTNLYIAGMESAAGYMQRDLQRPIGWTWRQGIMSRVITRLEAGLGERLGGVVISPTAIATAYLLSPLSMIREEVLFPNRLLIRDEFPGEAASMVPTVLRVYGYSMLVGTPLDIFKHILRGMGAPVLSIEAHYAEGIGSYVVALLRCSAKEAIHYWLKVADLAKALNMPIIIMWAGETDLTPEELGLHIGRIYARMNLFLSTEKPIDAVKLLREERE